MVTRKLRKKAGAEDKNITYQETTFDIPFNQALPTNIRLLWGILGLNHNTAEKRLRKQHQYKTVSLKDFCRVIGMRPH